MGVNDNWSSAAAYESYIGRWSRPVAREFVHWLAVPADKTWLDVGCGNGALTETLFEIASPRYIVGTDSSNEYVGYLRQHLTDLRLCFDIGDAQELHFYDEFYDNAVAGLLLNFLSEPRQAIAEMARVTKTEGTVAAYVWDYSGDMQMLRRFWDAAVELDPAARELDEGIRFKICLPETMAELFRAVGLKHVATHLIDVPTVFRDFDDYWIPFLGGQGPAPSYVASLNEEHRTALREKVRAALPLADNGSISLVARAWAVRGTR